jgi:hypothetical protein
MFLGAAPLAVATVWGYFAAWRKTEVRDPAMRETIPPVQALGTV